MNPCPSRSRLEELLAGQLGPSDEDSLESHVCQCSHCQQVLEELTAVPVPANLATRVLRGKSTESPSSDVLLYFPTGRQDPVSPLVGAVPKISDFGLAKIVDSKERLTLSKEVRDMPQYMSPEQVQGLPPSPAVDIWALGVILYEMLTGRTPFEAESSFDILQSVVNEEPLSLTRSQRKVPLDLETICLKCLSKEPRQRYASAGELADDLRCFLKGSRSGHAPLPCGIGSSNGPGAGLCWPACWS